MKQSQDGAGARRHRRHRRRGGARRSRARGWRVRALRPPARRRGARRPRLVGRATRWSRPTSPRAAAGRRPDRARGQPARLPRLGPAGAADAREHHRRRPRGRARAILLPGTVYNYGPDAFPLLAEDAPQHPVTRKGAIRVADGARGCARPPRPARAVLVVRAGDFFGPRAGNNWFSQGLVKPGRRPRSITLPGAPGVGHAWAYLPDVAETMVRLIEAGEPQAASRRFHMDGHWDPDGMAMADRDPRARSASPTCRCAGCPGALLRLAAPAGAALPRARRDALPLAAAGPARQPPAGRHPRRRAAHAPRPRGARDARRARLPAGRAASGTAVHQRCILARNTTLQKGARRVSRPARAPSPGSGRPPPHAGCRVRDSGAGGPCDSVVLHARAQGCTGTLQRPQPALRISCSREAVRSNSKAPSPSG